MNKQTHVRHSLWKDEINIIFSIKTASEIAWHEQDTPDVLNGVCLEGSMAGTSRADVGTWGFDEDIKEQERNMQKYESGSVQFVYRKEGLQTGLVMS